MTTPLIRCLKKRFPNAKIDFVVKKQFIPLLESNPHIHTLIPFDSKEMVGLKIVSKLQKADYDCVIDLQNSFRSRMWIWSLNPPKAIYKLGRWQRFWLVYGKRKVNAEILSVPQKYFYTVTKWHVENDGLGLDFFVPVEAKKVVQGKLSRNKKSIKKELVCIAPSASKKTKIWPLERYAKVANYFMREGKAIVLIGGKGDVTLSEKLTSQIKGPVFNLTGQLSLSESAGVIEASEVLVSNDTGMMHMATAVKTPVVAIFGPTTRDFGFFPYQAKSRIVEKELDCRPCSFHGTATCPKKHFKCMLEIHPEEVIEAVHSLLEK